EHALRRCFARIRDDDSDGGRLIQARGLFLRRHIRGTRERVEAEPSAGVARLRGVDGRISIALGRNMQRIVLVRLAAWLLDPELCARVGLELRALGARDAWDPRKRIHMRIAAQKARGVVLELL